jgi:DNA polymerase-1
MSKFLIIDGTALVFRGFYAIPTLQSSTGQHTNAILGFYTILFNLLLEQMPDYFSVCFDRPEETQRKKDFADYKATRTKAPDELYSQIGPIKQILESGNLHLTELAGIEADDLIATLAQKNKSPDIQTLIYSSDLDLIQLIEDNIQVLKPGNAKTGNQILTTKHILAKYGITPRQVQDYKGLRGDSSDNLPGVKGIGDKTATKLIQEFGSLENIYENIHQIKGAVKTKLETDKEQAFFCKQLATLQDDCKIDTSLQSYKIQDINFEAIFQYFDQLQISRLKPKAEKLRNKISQVKPSSDQISLF